MGWREGWRKGGGGLKNFCENKSLQQKSNLRVVVVEGKGEESQDSMLYNILLSLERKIGPKFRAN